MSPGACRNRPSTSSRNASSDSSTAAASARCDESWRAENAGECDSSQGTRETLAGTSGPRPAVATRVDRVRSSAVAMTGDRPAALVPVAPGEKRLLARAAGSDAAERLHERRLVRELQRGSADALEELFRREWPRAYRAAYLVVHDAAAAEDIAQEAFLAAVRAIDRFDRRRPFGPWMHRIVVNRAIDLTRARALRREVDAAAADCRGSSRPTRAATVRRRGGGPARAQPRAPGGRGSALPIRLHAGRDRASARHAARDRELAPAPGARPAGRRAGAGRVRAATEARIRSRLREQPLPCEGQAAARSWPVVEAALAERGPARRPRRLVLRLALVAALLCVGLVAALTPAGAAVGDWIEDRVADRNDRAAPAFAGLPDGGSVLTISRSGAYAIDPDGGSQRLGSFSEAGWSPHGLHVVGVDGRRLTAVDPTGIVKWTLARESRVHHPSWSKGLGYVVAYMEGPTLRVVAATGDPSTDRPLRRDAAAVTPAWRPQSDRILSYATVGGAIETVDVTSGRSVWRAPSGASGAPLALAWSRDARRLVALSSGSVTVRDATGRVLRTIALPAAGLELALHPSGMRAAVVVGGAGGFPRVAGWCCPG